MSRETGAIHGAIHTKTLRNPRSMSASHDPRKLAIWTLSRVEELFENWLRNIYEVSEHKTLHAKPKEIFEAGLFESGERPHKRQPYSDAFKICCLPLAKSKPLRVYAGRGIKHAGEYYWNEAFRDPSIQASPGVMVRYDPFDLSKAYAYVDRQWIVCRSRDANRNAGKTERQLRLEACAKRRFHKAMTQYALSKAKRQGHFWLATRQLEEELTLQKSARVPSTITLPITPIDELPPLENLQIYKDF